MKPDYRFGAFELRTQTGELLKHGVRLRLQHKPAQILELLVENPGELVTREVLRHKLWADGTFVDFEGGINTAANRLRAALNDSADAPRFIETIPRLGYRFIFPVTRIDPLDRHVPESATENRITQLHEPAREVRTRSASANYLLALLLAASTAVATILLVVLARHGYRALKTATFGPEFRQLTFRSDTIASARFLPNAQRIAYTAVLRNGVRQTNLLDLTDLHSQRLDSAPGLLASVSKQGDLAILTKGLAPDRQARLSRMQFGDQKLQTLDEGATGADWMPKEPQLAIVRRDGPESQVEFPRGHVVFRSSGWISDLRVSPAGDRVAFLEHPVRDDDGGFVQMVDRNGTKHVLTGLWSSAAGLAWSRSGGEVWFTAGKEGVPRSLYAVSTKGRLRMIFRSPSSLRLLDVSKSGEVLIALDDARMTLMAGGADQKSDTDISKFDCTHVEDISRDGSLLLFTECASAVGKHYTSYTRDLKSGQTIRLSTGRALSLSPDKRWALTVDPQDRSALMLRRLGSNDSRRIFGHGLVYQWARFLQGQDSFLVGGSFPGEGLKMYTQTADGGRPVPVEHAPYLDDVAVSPDGNKLAGISTGQLVLFDRATKTAETVRSAMADLPVTWSEDGRKLYILNMRCPTVTIAKMDIDTGAIQPWRTIAPRETLGYAGFAGTVAAPEAGAYAYSVHLNTSRLYLVSGWS